MYGDDARAAEQRAADQKFIDDLLGRSGSKAEVSASLVKEGYGYLARGYDELAVQRFNQAWLLDPDSPASYAGFGDIYLAQKNHDEAIRMYESALSHFSRDAMLFARLARLHQNKATELMRARDKKNDAAIDRHHARALSLYEQASRLTTQNEELDRIYYSWAVGLAMRGQFVEAWEKVALSRQHGGKAIEPKFLEKLSRDLPEPARAS